MWPVSAASLCCGDHVELWLSDFDLQQRRSCSPDEGIGSRSWSPPEPTGRDLRQRAPPSCPAGPREAAAGGRAGHQFVRRTFRTLSFRVGFPPCAGLTAVGQLVRRRVPEAVFLESVGQEITFVLPYSGARDGTFAQLFQDLDGAMSDLGLTSYGISDTTLEEVQRMLADASGC